MISRVPFETIEQYFDNNEKLIIESEYKSIFMNIINEKEEKEEGSEINKLKKVLEDKKNTRIIIEVGEKEFIQTYINSFSPHHEFEDLWIILNKETKFNSFLFQCIIQRKSDEEFEEFERKNPFEKVYFTFLILNDIYYGKITNYENKYLRRFNDYYKIEYFNLDFFGTHCNTADEIKSLETEDLIRYDFGKLEELKETFKDWKNNRNLVWYLFNAYREFDEIDNEEYEELFNMIIEQGRLELIIRFLSFAEIYEYQKDYFKNIKNGIILKKHFTTKYFFDTIKYFEAFLIYQTYYFEKQIKQLKFEKEQMKNTIEELETHIQYMPDGDGYIQAKNNFEELCDFKGVS